ncbi:MAG: DNA-binding domain-containing protein [Gammaproteobacteria bacterium]
MNHLAHVQKDFQEYLLTPTPAPDIQQHIVNTAQASAELRLGIYADAYRLRLAEVLSGDYEALHGLLGDEQFETLNLKYIDAHPSRHFSLRYFGQHMGTFLRKTEPYAGQPMLAELAEFEWALIDAFDARDSEIVTLDDMARLAPEAWPEMRFVLHDGVQRLDCAWNVQQIWGALKENNIPAAPQRNQVSQAWLIWRRDLATYFRVLSVPEAWALDAVRSGGSFAALCEGLCEWFQESQVAATAAGFLHRWVSDSLISKLMPAED